MGTVSVADDNLWDCARALRPVADYQLEPALDDRRLRDLGERKEFLSPEEHAELIDLVAFSRKRSIEKLGARLALACCKVGLERPLIPTAVVANLFRSARVFRWDAASRGLGDQRSQRTGGGVRRPLPEPQNSGVPAAINARKTTMTEDEARITHLHTRN
jgi:hypothetical protein